MMELDFTKRYRVTIDESLRGMRMQKYPMTYGDNIFLEDMLEHGYIRLYEYLGGTFYIPANAEEMRRSPNVVPIAGILISILEEEGVVQVEKIYCEFGYEDLIAKLIEQIMNFADFYGLVVSILNLRKGNRIKDTRRCRFVDDWI